MRKVSPSPLSQVMRPSCDRCPFTLFRGRDDLFAEDTGSQRRSRTHRPCRAPPSLSRQLTHPPFNQDAPGQSTCASSLTQKCRGELVSQGLHFCVSYKTLSKSVCFALEFFFSIYAIFFERQIDRGKDREAECQRDLPSLPQIATRASSVPGTAVRAAGVTSNGNTMWAAHALPLLICHLLQGPQP